MSEDERVGGFRFGGAWRASWLALCLASCGGEAPEDERVASMSANMFVATDPVWGSSTQWPSSTIPVCWMDSGWDTEKQWVRYALQRTWERETGVRFANWGSCSPISQFQSADEVRIRIADEGAHASEIGVAIAGFAQSVTLNFTFSNWRTGCAASAAIRKHCIEKVAVHEFGHVLGIHHEQIRDDTPDSCDADNGGTFHTWPIGWNDWSIGEWDLDSVMNYCNPKLDNQGHLSATDTHGIRRLYGRPMLEIAGITPGNRLLYARRTPGGFVNPAIELTGRFTDVDLHSLGRELHVLTASTDGQLQHGIRREDGTWSGWETAASTSTDSFQRVGVTGGSYIRHAGSSLMFGDELHVCATKGDGTLWYQKRDRYGDWASPTDISRAGNSNPGSFVDVDCARVNDELQIYGVTNTGWLYMTRRPISGGNFAAWINVNVANAGSAGTPGSITGVSVTESQDRASILVTTLGGQQYHATKGRFPDWTRFQAIQKPNLVDFTTLDATRFQNELVIIGSNGQGRLEQMVKRESGVWDMYSRHTDVSGAFEQSLVRVATASGGARDFQELEDHNLGAEIYDSGSSEQRFLSGDFNGDGLTDIFQTYRHWGSIPVCQSTGSSWSCANLGARVLAGASPIPTQFLSGDFNGDGLTDVIQVSKTWDFTVTCLSTGSSWDCSDWPAAIDHTVLGPRDEFITGDFNNDGRTDFIQMWRTRTNRIPMCLSTGNGWSCSQFPAVLFDSGSNEQQALVADVNDDGFSDVVQTSRFWGSMPTCLSDAGNGWSCTNAGALIVDSGLTEQRFVVGHFNDDAFADVVQTFRRRPSATGADDSATTLPVCFSMGLSTGVGWRCEDRPARLFDHTPKGTETAGDVEFLAADIDGDGRSDIVQWHRSWDNYNVCYSGDLSWNCDSLASISYNWSPEQALFVGHFDTGSRPDFIRTFRGWGSIPVDLNRQLRH